MFWFFEAQFMFLKTATLWKSKIKLILDPAKHAGAVQQHSPSLETNRHNSDIQKSNLTRTWPLRTSAYEAQLCDDTVWCNAESEKNTNLRLWNSASRREVDTRNWVQIHPYTILLNLRSLCASQHQYRSVYGEFRKEQKTRIVEWCLKEGARSTHRSVCKCTVIHTWAVWHAARAFPCSN